MFVVYNLYPFVDETTLLLVGTLHHGKFIMAACLAVEYYCKLMVGNSDNKFPFTTVLLVSVIAVSYTHLGMTSGDVRLGLHQLKM